MNSPTVLTASSLFCLFTVSVWNSSNRTVIIFNEKKKKIEHKHAFDILVEKREAEEKANELLRKKAELEEFTREQEEQKRKQQEEIEEMKRKQHDDEGEKEKLVCPDFILKFSFSY